MTGEFAFVLVVSGRFQPLVLAEACRAEGIRVELLTADDSGMGPHLALSSPSLDGLISSQ